MSTEHATLTEPYLHEPRGIAAATANKVYVSDGAGSGAWTATSTLAGASTDSFANSMFQITGTTTQSLTGVWDVRKLDNTVVNNITSSSVNTSTGTITLPAGTYYIDASAIGYNLVATGADVNNAVIRLRDTTASSTVLVGMAAASTYSPRIDSAVVQGTAPNTQHSITTTLKGVFTLGSAHTLQLQWYSSKTAQTNNSIISGAGETPILTNIIIWKTA